VIETAVGLQIREWARARLDADPHGSGPFDDEYHTSSLYFDTARLDVFHRRGSFGRAKFRIRRYSGADYAFIERKMRRPNLLVKRRTQVALAMLAAIERGELPRDSPAKWFHQRLHMRRLSPACLLSYHRTARGVMTTNGLARLTVDDGLHVMPASEFVLPESGATGAPILPGHIILELKYRSPLPDIFQELITTFGLQGRAASKYRLGMLALGHEFAVPDSREPADINAMVK